MQILRAAVTARTGCVKHALRTVLSPGIARVQPLHASCMMDADLDHLLEREQELAEHLDTARREARALVEAAQQDARARTTTSLASVTDARQRLADELERALVAELAEIDAQANARLQRLEATSPARIAALADQVLLRLLDGGRA